MMPKSSANTKVKPNAADLRVQWRPITLSEVHCAMVEAGYHAISTGGGRPAYYPGLGWGESDYDDAAYRLANWLLKRVNGTD